MSHRNGTGRTGEDGTGRTGRDGRDGTAREGRVTRKRPPFAIRVKQPRGNLLVENRTHKSEKRTRMANGGRFLVAQRSQNRYAIRVLCFVLGPFPLDRISDRAAAPRIDLPVVFSGPFFGHFGHFLAFGGGGLWGGWQSLPVVTQQALVRPQRRFTQVSREQVQNMARPSVPRPNIMATQ